MNNYFHRILICLCFSFIYSQENEKRTFHDKVISEQPQVEIKPIHNETVTSPNSYGLCGVFSQYSGITSGLTKNQDEESNIHPIYYLNKTAEDLASQGFEIIVNDVYLEDVLFNFTYFNSTFKDTMAYSHFNDRIIQAVGENLAPITRSYYMAQIGEKKGDSIKWLCDGVVLNRRWILSAAHCFIKPGVNPNIVRLGDHNLTDPNDYHQTSDSKFIRDYPLHKVILHPDFKTNERYHDLALIQILNNTPKNSYTIYPICLPWDSETNKDLVGQTVTLIGWGATVFNGPKTPILQEVNLTVYDSTFCDLAYADVRDTKEKYPQGITEDKVLCVGLHEDEKDACGGDYGGPILYKKGGFDKRRFSLEFVLAGIVSGGYGCGLKDSPGLYIPINKPKYLQWIKDVAFN